jgi:hypothetical protein
VFLQGQGCSWSNTHHYEVNPAQQRSFLYEATRLWVPPGCSLNQTPKRDVTIDSHMVLEVLKATGDASSTDHDDIISDMK